MTWLDQLLKEKPGMVVPDLPPEAEPGPVGDGWAGPLFDPALEALCSGLPPGDARDLRQERAGILEHEADFTRAEAERRAGVPPERAGRA